MVYQANHQKLFAVASRRKPAWFTRMEKALLKQKASYTLLFFQALPTSIPQAKKLAQLFDLDIFVLCFAEKKILLVRNSATAQKWQQKDFRQLSELFVP